MGRYSAFGAGGALASPGRTILEVIGAAGARTGIYDLIFGSDGTPADNAFIWKVMKRTVAGTATAFTPVKVDESEPKAATGTANANATAEPTFTANSEMLDFTLNMRATFRWVAAPGGELKNPATAANGIGARCQHASSTASNRVNAHWEE